MKRLTIGILAHVDSGKTTLSEAMLYTAGELRKLGRVDHQNAFLDTDQLERERGITIFSKQALLHFPAQKTEFTLLDTPGHVDFSCEMERTLQVLDYAILVISATEGIQSHTETLWKLLESCRIPVFLFVNKTDIAQRSQEEILEELTGNLHSGCINFNNFNNLNNLDPELLDSLAVCDEQLLDEILETGAVKPESVAQAILQRHVFPCCFGSALKLQGIREFLKILQRFTLPLPERPEFGAKVYKISEDDQGKRLTHLKITGGTLHVRDVLNYKNFNNNNNNLISEKISQIRIYSGAKFQPVEAVHQGAVCTVTGLSESYAGQGFGCESSSGKPVLEPILKYAVILPEDVSIHTALIALKKLEQEDPQLHVNFSETLQEIQVLLMGEIQLAVLQHILKERFRLSVQFQPGGVVYQETIRNTVEGMGHYEPLKHYAEVRLLLEPGAPGSGLQFASVCREDALERNWQRLILTHLKEKQHLGVLTGSPVTDLKITLTAGRAHKKHTEGGDFRQATYRAVRQGLMQAENVLLEPFYQFRMEVPCSCVGKILTDLQNKGAVCDAPALHGDFSVLEGKAPAVVMMQYQNTVLELTSGRGKLSCIPCGYAPCANPDEVIQKINYQPEADLENSPDSVFCSHGSGDLVKWDAVRDYMHTENYLKTQSESEFELQNQNKRSAPVKSVRQAYTGSPEQDEELRKIYEQTYGTIRKRQPDARDARDGQYFLHTEKNNIKNNFKNSQFQKRPEYLLVDGYNIIFAWDFLKQIASQSLDSARAELTRILQNYQGMKGCYLILVFDAYKIKNNPGHIEQSGDFSIVYTKEAETADTYIERVTHQMHRERPDARIRVATSDGMEQMIILGNGAYRMSAQELRQSVLETEQEMQNYLKS